MCGILKKRSASAKPASLFPLLKIRRFITRHWHSHDICRYTLPPLFLSDNNYRAEDIPWCSQVKETAIEEQASAKQRDLGEYVLNRDHQTTTLALPPLAYSKIESMVINRASEENTHKACYGITPGKRHTYFHSARNALFRNQGIIHRPPGR